MRNANLKWKGLCEEKMIRRKIGKIQLIIGIVVLIAGIVGIIASLVWFNDVIPSMGVGFTEDQTRQECPECSEPEIDIIVLGKANMQVSSMSLSTSLIFNLVTISMLFILISLLFITQGLLNLSEGKDG